MRDSGSMSSCISQGTAARDNAIEDFCRGKLPGAQPRSGGVDEKILSWLSPTCVAAPICALAPERDCTETRSDFSSTQLHDKPRNPKPESQTGCEDGSRGGTSVGGGKSKGVNFPIDEGDT